MEVFDSFVKSIELPKIIKLENNFYCISFPLMKLLPAKFIIKRADEKGLINKETIIIESSSGTFALGLALVCNALKYKFIIVSDPVMDDNLIRRIEDLGGTVKIVQKPNIVGGFQSARLEQVDILRKLYRNNFWTNQYDNPDNPLSYAIVAEQILDSIGNIDAIVGSVGSGGSMCGITTHLRKLRFVYAIGVDTNGSVLFGQNDRERILRGLGNSIFPKNLDHTVFNEVHWIEANQAYLETRNLHKKYSLFCGGTSGAAYSVANWYRKLHPSETVLAILPDEGYRYQETIYNDSWLKKEGLDKNDFSDGPKLVNIPKEATTGWFRILWDCRRYNEVINE